LRGTPPRGRETLPPRLADRPAQPRVENDAISALLMAVDRLENTPRPSS
jgi:hypothetical protein